MYAVFTLEEAHEDLVHGAQIREKTCGLLKLGSLRMRRSLLILRKSLEDRR
jgi:hypothetical protein